MSNKTKLKIIPLGGLEAIGMNITAFEYEDSIIVVDCGLAFPEDDMYGIDLVIPDITYLLENADRVKGFVFTHGHEDHIGALPYILKQFETKNQFSVSFIRLLAPGPRHYRIDFGKMRMPGGHMGVTMGFKDVEDEVQRAQEQESFCLLITIR